MRLLTVFLLLTVLPFSFAVTPSPAAASAIKSAATYSEAEILSMFNGGTVSKSVSWGSRVLYGGAIVAGASLISSALFYFYNSLQRQVGTNGGKFLDGYFAGSLVTISYDLYLNMHEVIVWRTREGVPIEWRARCSWDGSHIGSATSTGLPNFSGIRSTWGGQKYMYFSVKPGESDVRLNCMPALEAQLAIRDLFPNWSTDWTACGNRFPAQMCKFFSGDLADILNGHQPSRQAVADQVIPEYINNQTVSPSSSPIPSITIEPVPNVNQWTDDPYTSSIVDTDGDGYPDAYEDRVGTNLNDILSFPSPATDSDGDGVPDKEEIDDKTDPFSPEPRKDTDNDGLPDHLDPDPLDPDTDGDGLPDGTDPDPLTPDPSRDTDNDGLPDILDPNPKNPDTDGDGVPDGEEVDRGTNPTNPDTDNDGIQDDLDPDPLDPDTDNDGLPDGLDPDPEVPEPPEEPEEILCGSLACESTQSQILSAVQNQNQQIQDQTTNIQSQTQAINDQTQAIQDQSNLQQEQKDLIEDFVTGENAPAQPILTQPQPKVIQAMEGFIDGVTARVENLATAATNKFPFGLGGWIPVLNGTSIGSTCTDIQITLLGITKNLGWCDSGVHNFMSTTFRALVFVVLLIAFYISTAKLMAWS